MHYQEAKVYSHPRSGSHYMASLLNKNFFQQDDYVKCCYGGHVCDEDLVKDKNRANIYIHRKKEDVLKSVFKLRTRFGITTNDYQKFLRLKYKDQCQLHIVGYAKVIRDGEKEFIDDISRYFFSIDATPPEYHRYHKEFWDKLADKHRNVLIVKYEDLNTNFESTLKRAAYFLGSDKCHFSDIERKVGWSPLNSSEKIIHLFQTYFKKLKNKL